MRFGSPLAAGLGSPQMTIEYINRIVVTMGFLFVFKARAGYGNAYFGIYNNDVLVQNVYVAEGAESQPVRVTGIYGSNKIALCILRLGHFGDPGYQIARVARTFEADSARVTLAWNWKPRVVVPAVADGGYTSNWILSGISRVNTSGVSGKKNWGQLFCDLSVSGGNCTVTLRQGLSAIATGTAAIGGGPFSVTLAAANSSGVSGTVTISNTVATTTGVTLYFSWPKAMNVMRATSNPPLVVVATLTYDGLDSRIWTESADLANGTYYYNLIEVSDTGVNGTLTVPAGSPVTIAVPPGPPTNLAYASGTGAAGITLGFTASVTAGATYTAYVGAPGGQMDLNAPAATAVAGSTTIAIPAAAFTGYPGTARVLLRATNAGVEEKNMYSLDLILSATGVYSTLPPNAAALNALSLAITAGQTVAVRGIYSTINEPTAATGMSLFYRTPAGSYNFAAPLPNAVAGTVQKSAGSAAVVGTGTSFTSLPIGATITIPGGAPETQTITAIADDTHLTVGANFVNNSSGQTATVSAVSLASTSANLKSASFTYSFTGGTDAIYYLSAKAINAQGVQGAAAPDLLIDVSSDSMPALESAQLFLSRG